MIFSSSLMKPLSLEFESRIKSLLCLNEAIFAKTRGGCTLHILIRLSFARGISLVPHGQSSLPRRRSREACHAFLPTFRDATTSRTRWLIKDWDKNAVVCAGKVKLRSRLDARRRGCKTLFISVTLRHFFRRNTKPWHHLRKFKKCFVCV